VTSHCNTDAGARNAIEGGVGGIEHGGLLSDDTLRLMAKKGIHYTPTLIIQDVSHSLPPSSLLVPLDDRTYMGSTS
jgi:imidazolonepropionase-like amidohydrolase